MPYIENFREFAARMACPTISAGGAILFENGARSDGDAHQDPPSDPRALLEARAAYHREWAQRCERDFDRLKNALLGRGSEFNWPDYYGPQPTDKDILGRPCGEAALRRIKEIADEHLEAIAKILAEIQQLPEEVERRRREQILRESESRAQMVVAEQRARITELSFHS